VRAQGVGGVASRVLVPVGKCMALWRCGLSQAATLLNLWPFVQTCLQANPLTSQMPRREAGRRSGVVPLTAFQAGSKVSRTAG
jgi:hypothetical protein